MWVLRDVEVAGARLDCRIRDGHVVELGAGLPQHAGERVVDGRGGALLPGLADHHVHLFATAAARRSLDLQGGGLDDAALDDADDDEDNADDDDGTGWLRVVGAGVELTRGDVDARWPDRPVRVQHRSGALWTLNSAALARLSDGVSERERRTGQFWRSDRRLRTLLAGAGLAQPDVAALARQLASWGVTHVTDATPDLDEASAADLAASIPQHLTPLGPRKIVVPDHTPPDLDGVVERIRAAHESGQGAALHVVSAPALAVALAAFDEAGSTGHDRIEHAAICDDEAAARLADLGITVVTQPTLLARHGTAYLADSEPRERPWLWRHAGLLRAGVRVAVSSDAPYGDADPWRTVRAAVHRRTPDGAVVGADERVTPEAALRSLLASPDDPGGPPRLVRVGAPADLCLLAKQRTAALREAADTGTTQVRATFIGGACVHSTSAATGQAG